MRGQKLTLIALALLVSPPLFAQPDRLLLDLRVNGSSYGTAFVLIRDKHVLVDAEALERAHLPLDKMPEETVGSKHFVDVSEYPDTKVDLNVTAGRLSLTVKANQFASQQLTLNAPRRAVTPNAAPSAFVNYAFNAGTTPDATSVYLDAGFAYGRGLFRDDPSWSQQEGFSRGLTRYEYDDVDDKRRWTFGDQFAFSTDGLGGTALLGGVGVVRAFDLDPYLITFPQPTISGLLQAPGTVDVYENGVLVAQRQVAAGQFNLASLGLGPGANNVRVVIQDPFGGTRILQQNFYGSTQLLAQGLSDYAFQFGVERTSSLANGYESGRGVLLARENYGFTDEVTAGYRVEAQNGLVNAGSNVSLRLPLGYVTAGAAGSSNDGSVGHGSSVSYQYNDRLFSFGAGVQVYSSDYRRIGDDLLPPSERPRRVSYLNASWSPIPRLSVQWTAGDILYASGMRQRNIGIDTSLIVIGGASLSLNLNRQLNHPGDNDNQAMLNLVIPFGSSSIGFNGGHDSNSGNSYGFSAQRSVPTDNGWGYSINAQNTIDGATGLAQLDYQGNDGLVQFTGQRIGSQSSGSLLVSGSVIALDDHVYLGRTLQNGYALVETPGVADVQITRENQPVGKTDADGDLLVTNLLPYQSNKIGIDQNSVSLQDQIDATDQVIGVPRLGGTIVRFGVHALHAVRGTLTIHGKPVQYGSATLSVKGTAMKTLIGLDGSFYFSDLPAGSYRLDAQTGDGNMRCALTVPDNKKALTRLGAIACQADVGATP